MNKNPPRYRSLRILSFVCLFLLSSCLTTQTLEDTDKIKSRIPKMGVSVLISELKTNSQYEKKILDEFSSVTPENAMKLEVIHPEHNKNNFEDADFIVSWAKLHNINVRGHPVIWHRQLPAWAKNPKTSSEIFKRFFESHISELVSRYKDTVQTWDVINEALNSDGSLRKSIWLKNLGADYIKNAFILAHQANPNAKLFYNDYDIEKNGPKSDAAYDLLNKLITLNIPVHGIGFQMHLRHDLVPSENEIKERFKKFSDLGLEIHITELDIAIPSPSNELHREMQKNTFEMVSRVCRETESCKMISLWGLHDGVSWIPTHFKGLGEATLFDKEFNEKQCYKAFKSGLNKIK